MGEDGDDGKMGLKLERECWRECLLERKATRDNNDDAIAATESSWCLAKGKNLVMREVSTNSRSASLLHGPKTDQQSPIIIVDAIQFSIIFAYQY
jgi:hypothetical protein